MSGFKAGIALALVVGAVALIGMTSAAETAQAAKDCGYKQLGSTYVTSIKARHVSCRKARKVAVSYTKCRKQHGNSGRCRHRVKRFKCSERRYDKNEFAYSATVHCKRGSRRVTLSYTQNR